MVQIAYVHDLEGLLTNGRVVVVEQKGPSVGRYCLVVAIETATVLVDGVYGHGSVA